MPITKVTHFRCSDGSTWPSLEAAGQHEQSLRLLAWLRDHLNAGDVEEFHRALLKDYVLTPRKGWIA